MRTYLLACISPQAHCLHAKPQRPHLTPAQRSYYPKAFIPYLSVLSPPFSVNSDSASSSISTSYPWLVPISSQSCPSFIPELSLFYSCLINFLYLPHPSIIPATSGMHWNTLEYPGMQLSSTQSSYPCLTFTNFQEPRKYWLSNLKVRA